MDAIKRYLDQNLFPAIVQYAINRWHIVALLVIGIAMFLLVRFPSAEIILGNYTNIISALVSCIVLLTTMQQHQQHQQHHREQISKIASLESHYQQSTSFEQINPVEMPVEMPVEITNDDAPGTLTDKPCGTNCRNAKTPSSSCHCDCAGKNHGKDRVI